MKILKRFTCFKIQELMLIIMIIDILSYSFWKVSPHITHLLIYLMIKLHLLSIGRAQGRFFQCDHRGEDRAGGAQRRREGTHVLYYLIFLRL
jgi:hypothetical protein